MNPKEYSGASERILKPKIAAELGLVLMRQHDNADFRSEDRQDIYELKLRRKYRGSSGEHFTPSRRQFDLINEKLKKQTVLVREGKYVPNFGYIFLTYDLPFHIRNVENVEEAVDRVKIMEGFLADYRFVVAKDSSDKETKWYSITEKTLYHNSLGTRIASLLGSLFPLHIVSDESSVSDIRYLYRLARKFAPRTISSP